MLGRVIEKFGSRCLGEDGALVDKEDVIGKVAGEAEFMGR